MNINLQCYLIMEKENINNRSSTGKKRIFFALLLIIVGFLLIGFDAGFIPEIYKSIVISWQMLLIVLGVNAFYRKRYTAGLLLFSIGIIFLLPVLGRTFPEIFGVLHNLDLRLYWPIVLIAIGIAMIFTRTFSERRKNKYDKENSNIEVNNDASKDVDLKGIYNNGDSVDKNVLFSSSTQIVFSNNFKGGELNAAFGAIQIDLRKVKLSENNFLEANALFGSVILYIPEDWKINVKSENLFGGIQDKRINISQNFDDNTPALNFKGGCVFGSIEIRS